MLSSGLTLIFSMMGVLNFAHTSFYMLGAYFAYTISVAIGFWPALLIAPLAGRRARRRVRALQPAPGAQVRPRARAAGHLRPVVPDPRGGAARLGPRHRALRACRRSCRARSSRSSARSSRSRARSSCCVALLMLLSVWLLLTRTRIGLVIQAALTHPETVEALGHNVPRVFMLVFGGGAALAGARRRDRRQHLRHRAGDGRRGRLDRLRRRRRRRHGLARRRLPGVAADRRGADLRRGDRPVAGDACSAGSASRSPTRPSATSCSASSVAQIAPILPYLFLVLILIFRPKGLLGKREG